MDNSNLQELSERRLALQARPAEIRAELAALAIEALDLSDLGGADLADRFAYLQTELAMLPYQVGEIERRWVLARLDECRQESNIIENEQAGLNAALRPWRLPEIVGELARKVENLEKSMQGDLARQAREELKAARAELELLGGRPDPRKRKQLDERQADLANRRASVVQSVWNFFSPLHPNRQMRDVQALLPKWLDNSALCEQAAQLAGDRARARAANL